MGYGLPAAIGAQIGNPDKLIVCVSGDASVLMNIQELATAVQHRAPVKVFIINNQYMGMVRQWQEMFWQKHYSHVDLEQAPDFVKLAEAYGCVGIRAEKPHELDDAIDRMIEVKKPVLFDCRVAALANCFPMIPSGKAHNEMLLGDAGAEEIGAAIGKAGKVLV
jgi:acetolactate synthase-1/2/3 large subunit